MSQAGTVGEVGGSGGEDLHVEYYIVGSIVNGANFTTVTSAVTAAGAAGGGTVWLQPGTYTESFTLPSGVNLTAAGGDANIPTVTIIGKITFTSGIATVNNIQLQTNGDYAIVQSGSSLSTLIAENCYIYCTNHTGIDYTSTNSSSILNILNSNGNINTTGITLFSHSSSGSLNIGNSGFDNTGGSTTASTVSSGVLNSDNAFYTFPITTSSTSTLNFEYSAIAIESTAMTIGGSGTNFIKQSRLDSGTSTALVINSNAIVSNVTIMSNATNAISGTGTIKVGEIVFEGTSSLISTTTVTPIGVGLGLINGGGTTGQVLTSNGSNALPTFQNASGSLVLLSSLTAAPYKFTGLTGYDIYYMVFYDVVISEEANLLVQYSTNNGSSFSSTGYEDNAAYNNGTLFGAQSYNAGSTIAQTYVPGSFPICGNCTFFNFGNSSYNKQNLFNANYWNGDMYGLIWSSGGGYWSTSTVVNAIQVISDSGTITNGTIKLYGVVN